MESTIIGKWSQIEGQPYPGLFFNFLEDGTFEARYDALGIVSSGTWQTQEDKIDMDQQKHTFGLIGRYQGIFEIVDDLLRMTLVAVGDHERPVDLQNSVIYQKERV